MNSVQEAVLRRVFSLMALLVICPFASAAEAAPERAVTVVSPVFSQLVAFSFPQGFVPVFENTNGPQYIREAVPRGESAEKWSQMITLTGAKGLAANPNVTPQGLANGMAGGYRNACPTSFTGTGLGTFKLTGFDATAAVVSCGVANTAGAGYSEAMLLIVIRGERDYYTLQWAERGAASTTPIKFDEVKWKERFKRLAPVRLCPVVTGEKPPYPSCVGGA